MPIEVEGPGGVIVEFPDGTTTGTIRGAMQKRFGAPRSTSVAGTAEDVVTQIPMGFNRGIDNLLNLPGDVLLRAPARALGLEDYVPERGSYATRFNPGGSLYFGSRESDAPQTTPGRYAGQVGEALGASAVPAGGIVAAAPRLASMAATTVPRAVGQQVGRAVAANPAAAVGLDVVSATGSGIAQEGARDAGFGPTGQAIAGIAGGIATPLAAAGSIGGTRRALETFRAGADPHARVAASLGDMTVDDLANAAAVGSTRQDVTINRGVFDILGEEMVRANGNRTAARQETIARLVADGVAPATAEDQVRRVLNTQAGNNLMLGEFPAVAGADMATRNRNPYAPQSQVGRNARDIYQEEYIRAGGDVNVAERATRDRLAAAGVQNQTITGIIGRIRAGRFTDTELAAVTEPGTQTQLDYIGNAGTLGSSQNVRAAITQRAANLGERMLALVRGLSPGGQTIRDVENMIGRLRQRARADYEAVYNAPGGTAVNYRMLHGLLRRIADRHIGRMHGRSGDQADALRQAMERFYVTRPAGMQSRADLPGLQDQVAQARWAVREARRQGRPRDEINDLSRYVDELAERLRVTSRDASPPTQQVLMPSLQMMQDARAGIRGQIQAARQAGRNDIAAILQPLYNDVTRAMGRASPLWRTANRRWADMNLDQVGADLGDAFSKGAGPRLRQQLREFQQMAPEAQDVVRVHFVQKLLDEIEHEVRLGGQTNLGKLFDRQDKRNMIRAILGDTAANTIVRATRDANVMARSMAGIRGSQTHMRGQVQREQDADINAVAAAANFDWRNWRAALLERAIAIFRENRNRAMGRVLTTPMRDVPAAAEQIERMRRASSRVRAARQPPQNRLLPLVGAVAPVINPLME